MPRNDKTLVYQQKPGQALVPKAAPKKKNNRQSLQTIEIEDITKQSKMIAEEATKNAIAAIAQNDRQLDIFRLPSSSDPNQIFGTPNKPTTGKTGLTTPLKRMNVEDNNPESAAKKQMQGIQESGDEESDGEMDAEKVKQEVLSQKHLADPMDPLIQSSDIYV